MTDHRPMSTRFLVGKCLLVLATLTGIAHANVTLPRLVSDGMIIQRDKPITIWGWADENERVTVRLAQQTLSTRAKNGRWFVTFEPLRVTQSNSGHPFRISIQANNRLDINNVLAGDVWIGAGQSNMELPISRVAPRYPDLIPSTSLPDIREFSVPTIYSFQGRQDDFPAGQWKSATSDNLAEFSAVGFFYARSLYLRYRVPIGIISLAVGGSPAEAWMSEEALAPWPSYLDQYKKYTNASYLQHTIASDKTNVDQWYANANGADLGLRQQWRSAIVDDADWRRVTIPGKFREQHIDFNNGVIWLRKTVTLNVEQIRSAKLSPSADLFLGAMVDGDEVFVNGQLVGQTSYQYPPRLYQFNPTLLHVGANSIAIRLTSYSSNPEFVKDKTYALQLGQQTISLAGAWRYKVGMRSADYPQTTTLQYQPVSLFNAELAPTLHTSIRGVIWYQGESNTDRAAEYAALFPALIRDWRAQFKQGDFPFLYVQLANFMEAKLEPTESNWAQTREAQRETLRVKNTGMAVTIDVGEWNDIHPLNKQAVGERLALLAENLSYGDRDRIASGPLATGLSRSADGLLVHFSSATDALVINGAALSQIAIAGPDRKFHWANARIVGKSLLVWSDQVSDPCTVRYAWADNPDTANLSNKAGLPASPFQLNLNTPHQITTN